MAGRDILNRTGGRDILQKELSWAEVGQQAIQNIPASGGKFFSDMWNAVRHPIETGGTIIDIANGAMQLMIDGDHPDEKKARAVGKFFSDRYGTAEGFKRAVATDPVGVLGDLSFVFTGGGGVVAGAARLSGRAGGIVSKAGRTASKLGSMVDPLMTAGRTAKVAAVGGKIPFTQTRMPGASAVLKPVLGSLSGVGTEAVRLAASSGFKGGEKGQEFRKGMRGTLSWDSLLQDVQGAVSSLREQRAAAYTASKNKWAEVTTPLDFAKIEEAFHKVSSRGTYEGVQVKPSTVKVMDEMMSVIDEWRGRDPTKFHTPLGLDQLKQRIWDIRNSIPLENAAAKAAVGDVYHAVKKEIIDNAPEYGKAMKQYERASELLDELRSTIVKTGPDGKIKADPTVRALTSILRDNVNTNYGRRGQLAQNLVDQGAPNLMEQLAGASSKTAMPRGIQGPGSAIAGLSILAGIISGTTNPAALGLLGLTSPKLMGEIVHASGRAAGAAKKVGSSRLGKALIKNTGTRLTAQQAGRLERDLREQGMYYGP